MVAKLKSIVLHRVREGLVALALGATTIAAGCHSLDGIWDDSKNGPLPESQVPPPAQAAPSKNAPPPAPVPPSELPKNVVATWQHEVISAPDPLRDGQATPGLVGRVYLFDHFDHAKCYEGKATVKLYDERPVQGGPPVFLEEWDFPSSALRKLAKKDPIGWGYTLFLPTATVNPNITQIRMTVAFSADGTTVPVQSTSTFRLGGQAPVRVYSNQTVPSASYPPAQPQTAYPATAQNFVPAGYGQAPFEQPTSVAQLPGQYQQPQLVTNYPPPYPAPQSMPPNLGTLQLVQQQPMPQQQQFPAGVQQALAQQPYQGNLQQAAVPQRQFVTNPQLVPQQQFQPNQQPGPQQQQYLPNLQPAAQQQLQSNPLLTPPPAPQPYQGGMQQGQGGFQLPMNSSAPAPLPASFQRSTGFSQ
jgi:hypothetical protein